MWKRYVLVYTSDTKSRYHIFCLWDSWNFELQSIKFRSAGKLATAHVTCLKSYANFKFRSPVENSYWFSIFEISSAFHVVAQGLQLLHINIIWASSLLHFETKSLKTNMMHKNIQNDTLLKGRYKFFIFWSLYKRNRLNVIS